MARECAPHAMLCGGAWPLGGGAVCPGRRVRSAGCLQCGGQVGFWAQVKRRAAANISGYRALRRQKHGVLEIVPH